MHPDIVEWPSSVIHSQQPTKRYIIATPNRHPHMRCTLCLRMGLFLRLYLYKCANVSVSVFHYDLHVNGHDMY